MIHPKIAAIRQEYKQNFLLEKDANKDAIAQFQNWLQAAIDAEIEECTAMVLSTTDASHKIHSRIVLLKSVDANGFIFFTNYQSHKAQEISTNPHVSLLFFWKELQRQVRIEGTIQKIQKADSIAYFASRPRNSQIGAWASQQSKTVADRTKIDEAFTTIATQYQGKEIEMPPHWGGYIVQPQNIEFWQGRSSRMHDRLLYTKHNNGWDIERLMP